MWNSLGMKSVDRNSPTSIQGKIHFKAITDALFKSDFWEIFLAEEAKYVFAFFLSN